MLSTSKSFFRNPSAGGATDPSFAYVPLLLNTTSTNGQQNNTFLDSGTANGGVGFTITRNGTPTQGSITPYWPNGQWSNLFNGSSSLNLATNAIPTTGAFTFETFVYVTGTAASQAIAAQYPNGSASGRLMILWNDTTNKFTVVLGATNVFVSDATYSANTWLYLVVQRDASNVWSMYVNGTRNTATASNATAIDTAVTYIGNRNTGGTPYTGYISNLRVVTSALYSGSTISVPTTPFSVSTTNQVLLTCYSNRFIDANTATTAKVITVNGTPRVQAFQPFSPTASYTTALYGGSGYFNGSTDYLTVPFNTSLNFGSSDFTIEAWIYFSTLPSNTWYTIYSYGNSSGTQRFLIYFDTRTSQSSPGLRFTIIDSGGTIILDFNGGGTSGWNAGAWYHIALTRSTNTWTLYRNGTSIGTTTNSASIPNPSSGGAYIGIESTLVAPWNGYFSNLRVVKGTAVYTGAFTPPTLAPLTTAGSTSAASYSSTTNVNTSFAASATSLLTNFTNAGIYDAAVQNNLITVGDAQASTTITAQWPPTSMKFDGTGDWLTAIDNPQLQLGTGDFTIEGWFYLTANGAAYGIVSKGAASTGWSVNVTSGNRIQFSYTAANLTGSTTTLAAATWYYFAVVRSGSATGNLKIYINGTLEVTSGGAVTDNFNQTDILYVGASRTGTTPLNGYLEDIRITKAARTITASPTAAFPTR
jgi:hypothetical protein